MVWRSFLASFPILALILLEFRHARPRDLDHRKGQRNKNEFGKTCITRMPPSNYFPRDRASTW